MTLHSRPCLVLLFLSVAAQGAATAQTATPAPAPAPSTEPTPQDGKAPSQRIEITGGRGSDADQRRQSTASKIVIGREDIERYGDTNLLDLMKRLPGVTVPGTPGRGGNPRMRGMGGNYTQILIDGERMPPGFSLDSIPPEQIERIEILRAPTAETGARAIAGTINIVMREGFRKRLNDLRLAVQHEAGQSTPNLSWTRNDSVGPLIYTVSLSLFQFDQSNANVSELTETEVGTGAVLTRSTGSFSSKGQRRGLNINTRLQWRSEAGVSLVVQPMLVANRGDWQGTSFSQRTITRDPEPLPFERAESRNEGSFNMGRLNLNLNHRLGAAGPRLEWRANFSDARWEGDLQSLEFSEDGVLNRTIDETTRNRSRGATLGLKAVASLEGGHSVVGGAEVEASDLSETKLTFWNGLPQLTDFDANLASSTRRSAFYLQDEWSLNPQWAVHGGVRTEQITTRGEGVNATETRNTSRVTTPLFHLVYRPDEKKKDQVRASLTRSYRSPNTGQLIGRPSISSSQPTSPQDPRPNDETSPDRAGNPGLKPEIAAGLDVALERFLADGGVLSANVFHRRISGVIRNVVALEEVSWSPGVPRFVSRPANIGDARTSGIELEAKFRWDQLLPDAPRTDWRFNLSLFRSSIDNIPGPDNRITEQPNGTLNVGFDHRFRGTPWAVGGSWNHTPGYRTRLEADRAIVVNEKNAADAYASYTITPNAIVRLAFSNVLGRDATTLSTVEQTNRFTDTTSVSESRVDNRSYRNVRLGLELKL